MLLIIILNILFASTFIIAKAILSYAQPLFTIGFRMIIAGSALLFYHFFASKNQVKIKKSDYKTFILLSFIYIYIPFIFEFWALQYISAAKTALIYDLSPFVTAIFAYLLFREKINTKKMLGLLIGLFGFIPIFISYAPQELIYGEAFFISLPELCMIIAVLSSAYSWILIQQSNIPLALLNGASMLGGGILSLCSSLIFESWNPIPVVDFKNFIFYVLLIIIIGNFICYNLYAFLLKRYTATFLSFAGFTIPLFTALMQLIFFRTAVGPDFIITTTLVSLGIYIFYQEELKHGIRKV